jgi:predicted RNase H-like HicB family nuclease
MRAKKTIETSASEILKKPYMRVLVPEEVGGFSASIPEFPGCFAEGETIEETYAKLEKVALSWIEAAIKLKREIPKPLSNTSGHFVLRIPRSLHRNARLLAELDEVSLNQFVTTALAQYIGGKLVAVQGETNG